MDNKVREEFEPLSFEEFYEACPLRTDEAWKTLKEMWEDYNQYVGNFEINGTEGSGGLYKRKVR